MRRRSVIVRRIGARKKAKTNTPLKNIPSSHASHPAPTISTAKMMSPPTKAADLKRARPEGGAASSATGGFMSHAKVFGRLTSHNESHQNTWRKSSPNPSGGPLFLWHCPKKMHRPPTNRHRGQINLYGAHLVLFTFIQRRSPRALLRDKPTQLQNRRRSEKQIPISWNSSFAHGAYASSQCPPAPNRTLSTPPG